MAPEMARPLTCRPGPEPGTAQVALRPGPAREPIARWRRRCSSPARPAASAWRWCAPRVGAATGSWRLAARRHGSPTSAPRCPAPSRSCSTSASRTMWQRSSARCNASTAGAQRRHRGGRVGRGNAGGGVAGDAHGERGRGAELTRVLLRPSARLPAAWVFINATPACAPCRGGRVRGQQGRPAQLADSLRARRQSTGAGDHHLSRRNRDRTVAAAARRIGRAYDAAACIEPETLASLVLGVLDTPADAQVTELSVLPARAAERSLRLLSRKSTTTLPMSATSR